jgi:thymidylate synthase (FAD)
MRNDNVVAWEYQGGIHQNEVPFTKFIDEISAIKVSLVSSPEKAQLYSLFKNVANVSWDKPWVDYSYESCVEFLTTLISGGMLPLALEMNNFTFLIENVTRITTHAIVRGRVGMTYAQQSTGNADQRHADILIPRSMSIQNSRILESYIHYACASKIEYGFAVDQGMSVQEARIFLPSTNSNKIYLSVNLASLMNFYGKRSDRTEEYMQGNEICRQIKEIFNQKYPELSPVLRSTCGKSCAHAKNSPFVNGVYLPSKADDVFDWNIKSFLYPHTRDEMCWNETPLETQYYIGHEKTTKEFYETNFCTSIHSNK